MHNDKKYCDRCLWYENFCNVIDKYNGISVSTYADISKKKNVKTYILNTPLYLTIHQNTSGNTLMMVSKKTLSYFNIYCTGHWYFDDAAFSNASTRLTLLSILLTVT